MEGSTASLPFRRGHGKGYYTYTHNTLTPTHTHTHPHTVARWDDICHHEVASDIPANKQHMPGFKNSLITVPVLILGLPSTSSCFNLGVAWQQHKKSKQSQCISKNKRHAANSFDLLHASYLMIRKQNSDAAMINMSLVASADGSQDVGQSSVFAISDSRLYNSINKCGLNGTSTFYQPSCFNQSSWAVMQRIQWLGWECNSFKTCQVNLMEPTYWRNQHSTESTSESVEKELVVWAVIVASFVIPWLCAFILFLKLLKVIAPCWRTPKAGKVSRLSTSATTTIFGAFGINHLHQTRNHESHKQRNLFWVELCQNKRKHQDWKRFSLFLTVNLLCSMFEWRLACG